MCVYNGPSLLFRMSSGAVKFVLINELCSHYSAVYHHVTSPNWQCAVCVCTCECVCVCVLV